MVTKLRLLVLVTVVAVITAESCDYSVVQTNIWNRGFNAKLVIPIEKETKKWELTMKFSGPVSQFDFWEGTTEFESGDSEVTAESLTWSGHKRAGTTYNLAFVVHFEQDSEVTITDSSLKVWFEDGSEMVTCSAGSDGPEQCTGAFQQTEIDGVCQRGIIRVVPTIEQGNWPQMKLSFSRKIRNRDFKITDATIAENVNIHCWSNNCYINSGGEWALKAGRLVEIPIEIVFRKSKKNLITSMEWQNEDICNEEQIPEPDPEPTDAPDPEPTDAPDPEPTDAPDPEPTDAPDPEPTDAPDPEPTDAPDPEPTDAPDPEPTDAPDPEPTDAPDPEPTDAPDYDDLSYSKALELSLVFYEAQRSGELPENNRVPWRADSGLDDGVLGGYYDAGDHVKFGFPMAAMTTIVAWGAVDYKSGYVKAGQWEHVKEMIKWSTDYFIAATKLTDDKVVEFVGQIGTGGPDHAFWGRAEDMTMGRPTYKVTTSGGGSDLTGETAAALAAAAMVFADEETAYSAECLKYSKALYEFAETYQQIYTKEITDASSFYNSWSGFNDELTWGATWLFRATGDNAYLTKAESFANKLGDSGEFSWDNKNEAARILLAQITGEQKYKDGAENFCQKVFNGDKTPDGLLYIQQWGTLRHANNIAFACMYAQDKHLLTSNLADKTKLQVDYALGKNQRSSSYLIGFGENYPLKPHHRGSSCPDTPSPCGWNEYNSASANPQVLLGALVGGPNRQGDFQDDRNDYISNEVTTDYNAGFQSALAVLISKDEKVELN